MHGGNFFVPVLSLRNSFGTVAEQLWLERLVRLETDESVQVAEEVKRRAVLNIVLS
jgi:hypothetical protein